MYLGQRGCRKGETLGRQEEKGRRLRLARLHSLALCIPALPKCRYIAHYSGTHTPLAAARASTAEAE